METVRILRVIEYIGDRNWVENTLARSIKGTLYLQRPDETHLDRPLRCIRTAILTEFPEVLDQQEVESLEEYLRRREKINAEYRESHR